MKKLFLGIIIGVSLISLCSFTYYNTKNHVVGVCLCEYKLNGHLYVTATQYASYSGVGIIHSPNCPCKNK